VTDSTAISVILPTRALAERGAGLRRAIESVVGQRGVRAVPLVVINGGDADPALRRQLENDPRCRVFHLERPHLPAALREGRRQVDTPWFATLDDDDEFLPGGLARRLAALAADPTLDLVVSNGIRRSASGDRLQVTDPDPVRRDPLRALLVQHWLMPGSYLARSDRVGIELFDEMPTYLENTYLALRFGLDYRFAYLDEPTMIRHLDTPDSVSKSEAYLHGQFDALRRLLELPLPVDVRDGFRRRVAEVSHSASVRALAGGALRPAWAWHLRSLVARGGWRYLAYTRRLVFPWWPAR